MGVLTTEILKEYFKGKEKPQSYNVYFISDMHCCHKNILQYQPNRIEAMQLQNNEDVDGMNKYIYKMWNNTVKRGDHVYLLGDFCVGSTDDVKRCVYKLKEKGVSLHAIVGNHDRHMSQVFNQFASIDYIKTVTFKKSVFTFMDEDFRVCLCHYPMLSWPDKSRGSALIYGHIHSRYPFLDKETPDLMVNAGLDAPLSNYQLISLEKVWKYFKDKRGDMTASEYVAYEKKTYDKFIG